MHVIIVEPGKKPREADIENKLEVLQKTVGGYIQAIYPWDEPVALVCDDEAKLKTDTEWNRMLPETSDVIKGTFSSADWAMRILQIFLLSFPKNTWSVSKTSKFSYPLPPALCRL